MKFIDEHVFDAPVDLVERMYFDPAFAPRKYRELGLDEVTVVASNDDPEDFFVDCRFVMRPSLPLPGFIRKILPGGERVTVQQVDRWNTRTRLGELHISLHGLEPVSIHSAMSLLPHERGAVNRMSWTVECAVPLIGSRLADFLGRDIQHKSAHDLEVSTRILQDYV